MEWQSLGFTENPFTTDPIRQDTINLYVGRENTISVCKNVLYEKNVLLIVEGARGIGTTSFGNFLRFSSQEQKQNFTPTNEIRVGAGWTIETLLSVIISNIVREFEIFNLKKLLIIQNFKMLNH